MTGERRHAEYLPAMGEQKRHCIDGLFRVSAAGGCLVETIAIRRAFYPQGSVRPTMTQLEAFGGITLARGEAEYVVSGRKRRSSSHLGAVMGV
jgi:hypothetical protein